MTEANRPITEMPLNTFFEAGRDFYFNGEAIFLYHVPNAHTDGDIVVYFRGSDVVVAGDLFVTTTYPVIDAKPAAASTASSTGLNKMLDITVPAVPAGRRHVCDPGARPRRRRGRLSTIRDMLVIVRDRIQDLIKQG